MSPLEPDWLGAARRCGLRAAGDAGDERTTIAERVIETGTRGEGGDRTLEIDALAEEAVLAELSLLYDAGARFTVDQRGARHRRLRRRRRCSWSSTRSTAR